MGANRLTRAAVASVLVLVAAGCRSEEAGVVRPTGEEATVARVDDGDTLTLESGSRVRLLQVDAPELTSDCYGREALRALAGLVPEGARVRLVRDPALDDRDAYGRLLRYVFAGEANVNLALVRRGAASPYFFRGERGEHADELLDAVDEARDGGAGYWGACAGARLNVGVGAITGEG